MNDLHNQASHGQPASVEESSSDRMKEDTQGRVAVVGCGYWGKNLVRNFHELGALAAVCDPLGIGRDSASRIAPDVKIVSNYRDILDSNIQGIVIATPAETHCDLALEALAAGKDVFVEKPLALRAADGRRMVLQARANACILMVGHVLEYHPAIQCLIGLIRSGQLGTVQYLYSHRLSLGKVRREENALWSFAPHDIAIILRIIGSLPFQVTACGGTYIQPNIADVTVTNLLFDSGVRAHIHVSWLHPFKEQRLVVIGSQKMASFDDVSKQLVLYDQRVDIERGEPVPVRGEGSEVKFTPQEPLRLECQAFLESMSSREHPLTDGSTGVDVLTVLEAAQRSLVTNGVPVSLPIESFSQRDSEVRYE